jgi:hypothetical protein
VRASVCDDSTLCSHSPPRVYQPCFAQRTWAGRTDPALPSSRRPGHQEIVAAPNPVARTEGGHQGAIETAPGLEVDLLDAGLLAEASRVEQTLEAAIASGGDFAIDQQRQSFVRGEALEVGLFQLLGKGLGHARQAQGAEVVEGRLVEGVSGGSLMMG